MSSGSSRKPAGQDGDVAQTPALQFSWLMRCAHLPKRSILRSEDRQVICSCVRLAGGVTYRAGGATVSCSGTTAARLAGRLTVGRGAGTPGAMLPSGMPGFEPGTLSLSEDAKPCYPAFSKPHAS